MQNDERYTVVYDGTCGVCQRVVDRLRRWDRNHLLDIVASQAPGVRERFPWIAASAYAESIQLIAQDQRTWQGAAAIEELLRVLPRGRWISWLFVLPFARPIAERFYRWFARNRYRLGCGAHCAYHPAEVPRDELRK
jgi:predicted DCC family thiol-disulfide oxidoreductase YuxK